MNKLIKPKRIAVVGASSEVHKIGFIIFDNLLSNKSLQVFPINPNTPEILNQKAYATVLDVKSEIDLAIIAVPEKIVPKVLESCGKKKIPFAIIISAGFSETGAKGQEKEKEKELLAIAKKFSIRILGPNCLGMINNFANINASFATAKMPGKYRMGIFSQSGAMGAAMLDFANGNNLGFSYFVSLGNKIDISEVDLLKAWVEDENVNVGVGYLEDIKDGAAFINAAKKFTAKKPLIILKGGRTKEGNEAARLHTAALACDERVFEAAMAEAGVILAENLNDMLELAFSFAQNGLPKGNRLAIVSNAGGPSVLATDAAAKEGVALAELSGHSINHLIKNTEAASVANPIDLRGDATQADFKAAFSVCEKDPNVDAILAIVTPQAMTEVEGIAWEAVAAKKMGKKPIYINFIGGELVQKAKEICAENGLALFSYPERAVRAFRYQSVFAGAKKLSSAIDSHPRQATVKSLIHLSGGKITASRLSVILKLYGVPMAETVLAKSGAQAAQALKKVGQPAVMKIASPDILHKTDIGGVMLGVETEEEAKEAYEKIITNTKRANPKAGIEGVIVMSMAKEGLEVIVGAKKDPVFGSIIMFGFGGIFVELISDVAIALAPFSEEKIESLIEKTAVAKIINGYRGHKGFNKKKLIEAVMGIGRLVAEHPEISQVEVNPLVLEKDGSGIIGLDAKIVVGKD